MTYRELCEGAVRLAWPDLDADTVTRRAKAFFDSSPTGEVWHVFDLAEAPPDAQAAMLREWFERTAP